MTEFIEVIAGEALASADVNTIVYFDGTAKVIKAATGGAIFPAGVLLNSGASGARVRIGVKGIFLVIAGEAIPPHLPVTATAASAGKVVGISAWDSDGAVSDVQEFIIGSLRYLESNGSVHASALNGLSNFNIDMTNMSVNNTTT